MEATFSECIEIYWDQLIKKIFTGGNVRDSFSSCFRYLFNYSYRWFDFFMYTCIWSSFLYDCYVPESKFISTSRKLTIIRLVYIVKLNPNSVNSIIMAFLFPSISGLDKCFIIAKPLSLYEPKRSLSRILYNRFNI